MQTRGVFPIVIFFLVASEAFATPGVSPATVPGVSPPGPPPSCVPKTINSVSPQGGYGISDQLNTQMCTTFAVSAMVDAYRASKGSNIVANRASPVSLLAFKKFDDNAPNGDTFGIAGAAEGVKMADVVDGVAAHGACSQSKLAGYGAAGSGIGQALQGDSGFLRILKGYLEDFDRHSKSATQFSAYAACSAVSGLGWRNTEENFRFLYGIMGRLIASYGTASHATPVDVQRARTELFKMLVKEICWSGGGFLDNVPTKFGRMVRANADDPPFGAPGLQLLNQKLTAGYPVAIAVTNRFWRPDECRTAYENPTSRGRLSGISGADENLRNRCNTDRHAMIVTGRDYRNGKCQYRVRNSWGSGCSSTFYSDAMRSSCSGGEFWVDEDTLNFGVREYHYVDQ